MHLVCSGCCQTKLLSRGSCKIADAWHSFARKSNIRNMLVSRSSLSVNDDTFHSIHIVSLPNTFRFLRIANENPNWIWWCFPIITAFYELERYDASTDDQMEEYLGMAYLVGFCTASNLLRDIGSGNSHELCVFGERWCLVIDTVNGHRFSPIWCRLSRRKRTKNRYNKYSEFSKFNFRHRQEVWCEVSHPTQTITHKIHIQRENVHKMFKARN